SLPAPAPRSTSTRCPWLTRAATPAGVSATRRSSGLISLSTPTITIVHLRQRARCFAGCIRSGPPPVRMQALAVGVAKVSSRGARYVASAPARELDKRFCGALDEMNHWLRTLPGCRSALRVSNLRGGGYGDPAGTQVLEGARMGRDRRFGGHNRNYRSRAGSARRDRLYRTARGG